jgi:signal transduction histidine kinase
VGINIRILTLAATLGLAGATEAVPRVSGGFLLLCVIALVACVSYRLQSVNKTVPVVEGAAVGLVLGITGLADQPLAMYLIAPALLAGLVGGTVLVSATFLAEACALLILPLIRLQPELVAGSLRLMLPWLLTSIGIGLLGSWIRRLGGTSVSDDHERYVAANDLLSQLRRVSRRLSSGLDPVAVSTATLDECLAESAQGRGALLVRTDGGAFSALALRSGEGSTEPLISFPLVLRCWTTARPVHGGGSDDIGERGPHAAVVAPPLGAAPRFGSAFPIRVGTRMIGVLVLDLDQVIDSAQRLRIQAILDERALPLDTAMLFDEVRTGATVDERRRVAREIHDGVAQEIVSLSYLVDDLGAAVSDDARAVATTSLRTQLTRIVDDLRLSIFDLRGPVSRSTGIGAVLGDYLQVVASQCGAAVHLTLDEATVRLRLDVEEELLRIVQEAITNARKHAGAGNLWVSCLVRPPRADVVIEDDGRGLGASHRRDSFGMTVMQERADRIGATLVVGPSDRGGTRVSVSLDGKSQAGTSSPSNSSDHSTRWLGPSRARSAATHG